MHSTWRREPGPSRSDCAAAPGAPPERDLPLSGRPDDMALVVYDSRADADLSSATRSCTVAHMLVLRSAELGVELEFFGSTVVGQVVPPSSAQVELVGRGRPRARIAATDAVGGFVFEGRTGPFRIKARTNNGKTLQTEWLPIAN
jgi:hypothetical protein